MDAQAGQMQTAMNTPWNVPVTVPTGPLATMAYENISVMSELKPYSLRNGRPEDIVPYLLTSAISENYHWIPMNGLAPRDALRCVDGFIRCYLYKLSSVAGSDAAANRRAAIILGVARAVMTNNYELTAADINPREIAAPLLSVTVPAEGSPTYATLVSANAANVGMLTENLALTPVEINVIKVIARSAQAIIPVQGLNLITDGHHYLSEKSKQSYKAFLAVEKQVWVPAEFKTWAQGIEETVKDLLWHKAGHPVAVSLKEAAATDPSVKANLEAAKMGSAAARLPALESDLRAADTYLKLAEAVDAIWATMGGEVKCDLLRLQVEAVKTMSRTEANIQPAVPMGDGFSATSRAGGITLLRSTVARNSEKAALLYGFYCSILDAGTGDMMGAANDTLRSAFSLKKLRTNNVASFLNGVEIYKDYRAMRQSARRAAVREMPKFNMDD